MPEIAPNTSQIARWRPWHALALLVAAYAVFNVFLNPMRGDGDEFPTMLWMGAFFMQPVVFAMWTAIGPPPATKRIPFALAGFVFVVFAACVPQFLAPPDIFNYPNDIGPESLIMPGALFAAALVVALAVRILTRWSIRNTRRVNVGASGVNQFSIKYLLLLTAVCAVLLGFGRWLTASMDWSFGRSMLELVARIWLILLVTLPAVLVPITLITFRPTLRMYLGTIISVTVLAWVAIETVILLDNPPGDVAREILVIQLGAFLAGIASALVVRFAGYRLFRKSVAVAANHQP
jgi:hypothetical protein